MVILRFYTEYNGIIQWYNIMRIQQLWTRGALDFHGIVFGQIISYDYATMGVYMIGWFWGFGPTQLCESGKLLGRLPSFSRNKNSYLH